jgi:hypothetical protein
MVQDVRSSTGVVFDLLSEAGVLATMAYVRASNLPREEKRELRDLLFSYTSSGGDAALRTLIESRLATIVSTRADEQQTNSVTDTHVMLETLAVDIPVSVTSVSTPPVAAAASVVETSSAVGHGFAQRRPAPVFSSVLPADRPLTPPDIVAAPATPVAVVEPSSVEMSLTAVEAVVAQARVPDPEPVLQVPKSIVDEKLVPLAPTPTPIVAFEPTYREDASLDQYRARIAEIKQMINTKVGNPVNLVDLNNEVGRAYMTALLEAMKAVSGGGGDPAAAMTKLEAVVKEVTQVLASAATTTLDTDTVSTVVSPIVESIPTKAEEVSSQPVDVPTSVIPRVPVTSEDVVPISPMRIASSRFKNVLPVTEREPLKTPADLPTAQELKARSGITDPLLDPDVDLGLEQLLGEWSLFKKSGVFGTGPKGRQHPLFQKLAPLQMPLILSGRFEGATTEIRQSITDYMNGWRYEQGIIYEQDETLEHYLRRVIRHIIDSQTRRRGA